MSWWPPRGSLRLPPTDVTAKELRFFAAVRRNENMGVKDIVHVLARDYEVKPLRARELLTRWTRDGVLRVYLLATGSRGPPKKVVTGLVIREASSSYLSRSRKKAR